MQFLSYPIKFQGEAPREFADLGWENPSFEMEKVQHIAL